MSFASSVGGPQADMADRPSLDVPRLPFRGLPPWEWVLLLVVLVIGATLRLVQPELSYYNLHVERDVYRATQLVRFDAFPLLGSEMQYGGRIFGPLIYFIYAVPILFSQDPAAVMLYVGIVNTILLAGTWAFTRYWFGPATALVATALFATFPLEIVQLRYMWNPCFLPALIVSMYFFLFRYAAGRRDWNFLGAVAFFALAFQIHFSVLMAIPVLLAGFAMAGRFPRWRVIGLTVLLIGVLYAPYILHEISSGSGNTVEVIESKEALPDVARRFAYNPNAWRNLLHVVTLDWNESGVRMGFTYLYHLRAGLSERLGERFPTVNTLVTLLGSIHFVLWLVGVLACLMDVVGYLRDRRSLAAEDRSPRFLSVKPRLLLLLWQFSPMPFLCFFSLHNMAQEGVPGLIPLRYYLIVFPAQFILVGVAVSRIAGWFAAAARPLAVIVGVLATGYTVLDASYINLLQRTGIAIPYLYFRTPTLKVLLRLREVLLDKYKITADDYYERVTGQNILVPYCGEATMDYLITQDPRAYTNPGLPKGTHLIVYRPVYRDQPPIRIAEETRSLRLPDDASGKPQQVLKEKHLADISVYLVKGTLPTEILVFQPHQKTNVYYREERMKYLGRERLPQ